MKIPGRANVSAPGTVLSSKLHASATIFDGTSATIVATAVIANPTTPAAQQRSVLRKKPSQPCIGAGAHWIRSRGDHRVTGGANFASSLAEAFSTSAWRLFPRASIVTITGKSLTLMCHIASGTPNSRKSTPSTSTMQLV